MSDDQVHVEYVNVVGDTLDAIARELAVYGLTTLRVRRNMSGPGFECIIGWMSLDRDGEARTSRIVVGRDTTRAGRAVLAALDAWRKARSQKEGG